jgi:hypothetical protein
MAVNCCSPLGMVRKTTWSGSNLAGNQQAHRDRFSQGRIGIGEVIGSGRVQYMCEQEGWSGSILFTRANHTKICN